MKLPLTFKIFLCVFISISSLTLQAQTIRYVKAGAAGSGASWADASGDFQGTIDASASGDFVFVAQGTYQPAAGQSFSMKSGVKIYGGFAGTETSLVQRNLEAGYTSTLQGNGNRVIRNVDNGLDNSAVLDGFLITGGNTASMSNESGAGMLNVLVSPTISNCTFSENIAFKYALAPLGGKGGGMCNNNSSPVITNCKFLRNEALSGGG